MKLFLVCQRLCIIMSEQLYFQIIMKKSGIIFILFFFFVSISNAQLRDDLKIANEQSSIITYSQDTPQTNNWLDNLNMTMSHSYSMNFSNFGGQTQNINAYTNSMMFDVSENLDAQVDISFLHSPFGNNLMGNNNSLGSRIIIDSARLDYQLSPSSSITIEFSQRPYHSPFGYGGFSNNRYHQRSIWY